MTDKQFYDNQNKAVGQIRSAVDHYKHKVINSDMAMIKIIEALSDMDERVKEIVKGG